MALGATALLGGCFDSHCPEGTDESECSAGGGGGGGGGEPSLRELCLETCRKTNECFDAAEDCDVLCDGETVGPTGCRNEAELVDALQSCNGGPCGPMGSTYTSCLGDLPACE